MMGVGAWHRGCGQRGFPSEMRETDTLVSGSGRGRGMSVSDAQVGGRKYHHMRTHSIT